MDIFRFLLFVLVLTAGFAVFLAVGYLLELFARSKATVSVIAREYIPVVIRGTYLGLAIALIGSIVGFFVGSLWPIPLLVFLVSATGLGRRILPRQQEVAKM